MASSVAAPLERQFSQIPNLVQMSSTSTLGSTAITLQFDLDRNIDAAAGDVQTAINAAGGQLPKNLPNPPTYRKTNPADSPVVLIGLWSDALPIDQVDDYADTRMAQQIAQLPGVGQVNILGEAKPAVRVRINPAAIAAQGLSMEDVRAALGQASLNAPKGSFNGRYTAATIDSNDQIVEATEWRDVVVAYRNGAPVHVSDIGTAVDSVEDVRAMAGTEQRRSIIIGVFRQPGANIIKTADLVKAELPRLTASIPPSIHVDLLQDRTRTIRASVADVEFTLVLSIALVVMVIFLFLRKLWATVIPGIAVPLSLVGTFAAMYAFGFSLDNLSLMAMTIAVGFVVDDAIVMIENIVRYMEEGDSPYEAAVKGAGQIGFTILSITISLIAVFIPLLLMGGIVGRLFREFAVTVSVAVLISAFVSLTLTPTMCALFLGRQRKEHGRLYNIAERFFERTVEKYRRLLAVVLRHQRLTLLSLIATVCISGVLFYVSPKGFFPQQDNGLLFGTIEGPQDISFEELISKTQQVLKIFAADPAVESIPWNTGGGGGGNTTNTVRMYASLKPFEDRDVTADEVIHRLMPKLAAVQGVSVHLQARQDITVSPKLTKTQFQYTLQTPNLEDLNHWSDVMLQRLKQLPQLADATTDAQNDAPRIMVKVDRETAARLGIQAQQIDDTLYDAFGQRQVGTIFTQLTQYHVVLEVDPRFQLNPDALNHLYVRSNTGKQVPLSAFARFERTTAALSISHQGQFPAVTLSFNLAPGAALGQAVEAIRQAERDVQLPQTVQATFQGNAQAFQDSLVTMPLLIAAAIVAVYIVLGILYESYIHPLTILSTIPSAGVGALLFLRLFGYPLDMMGLIGIILLIGIVKKNAIMMIDFAIEAERHHGKAPQDAIFEAALLRFRPIMMTTMSALFSGLPLMLAHGAGGEFRRPLGVAIVGGLLVSQALTLFTTPVVYLYLDRLNERLTRRGKPGAKPPVVRAEPGLPVRLSGAAE
jgi:HAE1 family hydrophobic/amphiphilic exporter-1/multidrug efflux pump